MEKFVCRHKSGGRAKTEGCNLNPPLNESIITVAQQYHLCDFFSVETGTEAHAYCVRCTMGFDLEVKVGSPPEADDISCFRE